MITITKIFPSMPFAHRQPNHKGHCRLIHGHNWTFELTFAARNLDECGFVVDFGSLKWIRTWLEDRFDHTLVLNRTDPMLPFLMDCLVGEPADKEVGVRAPDPLAKVTIVENCGCEGLATYVLHELTKQIKDIQGDWTRWWLASVTLREDEKNSATVTSYEL